MVNNRQCRKCNDRIPNNICIDGKQRSLSNRKFCLQCSPFGKHNTSKTLTISGKKYRDWSQDKKKKHIKTILAKGEVRKLKLIELLGGKCKYCGYSKCISALCFHHLNPVDKLFGLSKNNLWSKSWENILQEASKCELLCVRCHAEIEAGLHPSDN